MPDFLDPTEPFVFVCAPTKDEKANAVIEIPEVPEFDLTTLAVDGTRAQDSAKFVASLISSAKGLKIKNVLDFVAADPEDPVCASVVDTTDDVPTGRRFGAAEMKTLPIEPIDPATGRKGKGPLILLPQGRVEGKKTSFKDSQLGDTPEQRLDAANLNSDLLKRLLIAPGVSKAGTKGAHLDFARLDNMPTDILYLSGHGSVAGSVCGEAGVDHHAPGYISFFEVLSLLHGGSAALTENAKLLPPAWIVIAACYSMTPGLGQVWLRILQKQKFPVRGILGYRMTAPLADEAAPIASRFCSKLAAGATFLEAWKEAHPGKNLKPRWSALVFDDAKGDTLASLKQLRRSKPEPTAKDRDLYFCAGEDEDRLVKVEPPDGLLEMHHWAWGVRRWNKVLVTNLDLTEVAAGNCAGGTEYKANASWTSAKGLIRMVDETDWWEHHFRPGHYYALQVYPPFREGFEHGFKPGDRIELSLVHVRHHYDHGFDFTTVLRPVLVNGEPALDEAKAAKVQMSKGVPEPKEKPRGIYMIPAPAVDPSIPGGPTQQSRVRNRIAWDCPPTPEGASPSGWKPARLVVKYSDPKDRLWFWFRVAIIRGATQFAAIDFDTFIITPEHDYPEVHMPADAPIPDHDP
jgi:hypothetical protein